jgi:hypothetical protein
MDRPVYTSLEELSSPDGSPQRMRGPLEQVTFGAYFLYFVLRLRLRVCVVFLCGGRPSHAKQTTPVLTLVIITWGDDEINS